MSHALSLPRFDSVESFETWVQAQPDAWELHDGIAVAMAPERAGHTRIKLNTCIALREAIANGSLPCEALIDGLSVPGPGLRRFKPDVIVVCGQRPTDDAQIVDMPLILVEVLSPTTENADTGIKLESYLALSSVQHYLVISTAARTIFHHQRWDGDRFLTSIIHDQAIKLDPPGLEITVEEIYRGTDLEI